MKNVKKGYYIISYNYQDKHNKQVGFGNNRFYHSLKTKPEVFIEGVTKIVTNYIAEQNDCETDDISVVIIAISRLA